MKLVYIHNQRTITDSLIIAETFEKNHKDVLRDIRNLDCSEEFNQRNFAPIDYKDEQNRTYQKFLITQDGFSFLVMGYTGKEAARFKEMYIGEFNRLREQLHQEELTTLPNGSSDLSTEQRITLAFKELDKIPDDADFLYLKNEMRMQAINLLLGVKPAPLPAAETKYEHVVSTTITTRSPREDLLNPTQIGELIGLKPHEINRILGSAGLQEKVPDSHGNRLWRLTDSGRQYGDEVPFQNCGFANTQVRWKPDVIDFIQSRSKY